jgi:hypothetical protein
VVRYILPTAVLFALIALFLPGREMHFSAVGARQAGVAAPTFTPPNSPSSTSFATVTPSGTIEYKLSFSTSAVPTDIRGIYLTAWIAGLPARTESILKRAEERGINAAVVDVKDYSGYVSYKTGDSEISKYGAEKQMRITDIDQTVRQLKEHHMYAIARITIFQDSILAKGAPQWALKSKKSGGLWLDNKGLAWMDASSQAVWDYNIRIAKNALAHGFDEVNLDYVRFPSDGVLSDIVYPSWDGKGLKHEVVRNFFAYVRQQLPDARISADVFGLVAVREDDMGIGQLLEDALPYFDAVAPMTYPSHYVPGLLGYKNPADHPYEIMKYSLEHALARAQKLASTTSEVARIRPWFQAFDLGATYDQAKMDAQRKAYIDVRAQAPDFFDGYLLWDPKNSYTYF